MAARGRTTPAPCPPLPPQSTQFYEVVEQELGWTNLVLRKQLFKAFDLDGHGDVDFREFCEAYSVMLRGTVPELLDFAWRVYHMQGPEDRLAVDDMYNVLRLALAGLEEVRKKQGKGAGGMTEESRFPDKSARAMLDSVFTSTKQTLTRREFSLGVLRHRMLVDCLVPGFELIPQDALHRAAEAGEVDEVRHLLDVDRLDVNGEDGKAWPTTPLHLASQLGHADIVRELIARGANPRLRCADGTTAIDAAVMNGKQAALAAMLESGVDPMMTNGRGQTPLHTSAACGNLKALDILMPHLNQRVVSLIDDGGSNPVHCAAAGDHFMAVNTFLEYEVLSGVDEDPQELNMANAEGKTALLVACESRAYRTAKRLLELGADARALDFTGQGVLHKACSVAGNEVVLEMLLESEGAELDLDIDLPDNAGTTPLIVCVRQRDIKMLKMMIQAGADTNVAELATGYTPLHLAVLANWFEGVDALISGAANTEILLDLKGLSPYDYARVGVISELLSEYIEEKYKQADETHPVIFDFGLVFDEGKWVMATAGPKLGERVLDVPKVPRETRLQRINHHLVDKDSIVRILKRAGLFVHLETVFIQERALGVFPMGVRQLLMVRVGAPLFRIQLEAERMRLRIKRSGANATEFFVDHHMFPDTGFEAFSRGERQQVLMNIIEAPNVDSPLTSLKVGPRPAEEVAAVSTEVRQGAPSGVADVSSAGIKIAMYIRLLVIHSFVVLHESVGQEEVLHAWNLGEYRRSGYWMRQLRGFFESKGQVRPLQAVFKYFGSKLAFYEAFVHHLGHSLLLLSLAGIVCFGVLFVPLRPASMTTGKVTVDISYDHPITYVFFLLMVVWAGTVVRTWDLKEGELRYRWRLDTVSEYPKTPNPTSTAVVKRLFVNNSWQFVPVSTPAMIKARIRWILASAGLWVAFVAASLFSSWAIVVVLLDIIDDTPGLHTDFDNPLRKDRNALGTLVLYSATAANAAAIYVLNNVWQAVAVFLTYRENYGTVYEHDTSLAIKLLSYQVVNGTLTLFYLAYHRRDYDQTAAMLAAIIVVGQIVSFVLEYLVPWITSKSSGLESEELIELATTASRMSHAGNGVSEEEDDSEDGLKLYDGDERPPTAKGVGYGSDEEDMAETGDILAAGLADEGQERLRFEILAKTTEYSVEFAPIVSTVGIFMAFGAAWPLSALALLLGLFTLAQMDVWKFNRITQRPLSERWPGIGVFRVAFEALVVLGVVNHCFFIAMSSDGFEEYLLTQTTIELDTWTRLFIGFALENVALALYFVVRLWGSSRLGSFITEKKAESLRTVKEAYQLGIRIREQRYSMMAANPAVSMKQVCKLLGIDVGPAEKYLTIVRFLDGLPAAEKRSVLLDSNLAISSLVYRIELASRSGTWADPGEPAGAPGLLKQLVPVVDLKRCYELGKEYREALWRTWNANSVRLVSAEDVDPDEPRVVASLRQLAAFDCGITVKQAERYTRLCRFVDAAGGNPYRQLERMAGDYPTGLLGFLESANRVRVQDDGDPLPSAVAGVVEPVVLARDAVARAQALRRWMYNEWLQDTYLQPDEMLARVVAARGSTVRACRRYLLINRYLESIDPARARAITDVQRMSTLALALDVSQMIAEGTWVDPGDPDFYDWTPPEVPDAWSVEGWLGNARGGARGGRSAAPSGAEISAGDGAGGGGARGNQVAPL